MSPKENSFELTPARHDETLLSADALSHRPVVVANHYATDETDEFTATYGGRVHGIFKTWAQPVIAELETGIAGEAGRQVWSGERSEAPMMLYHSLERWRAVTEVTDARLQQVFSERELPDEPTAKVTELLLRQRTAFAYAEPFYDLEAMVGDAREEPIGNPINFNQPSPGSGALDTVGMLLPAAMSSVLDTSTGEWSDGDWAVIQGRVDSLKAAFVADPESTEGKQFILLHRVADKAGITAAEALFAANLLEFIPAAVGGKSDDMPQNQALETLLSLTETQVPLTTNAVGRDINAGIRFRNWTPAITSPENFTGENLAYDAACATSNQLVKAVNEHHESVIAPDYVGTYVTEIMPQLGHVDASSAKGRLMLELLEDGHFTSDVTAAVLDGESEFRDTVLAQLQEIRQEEAVLPIRHRMPTLFVGGKADGLRRASDIFEASQVADGVVVTSEAIRDWLSEVPGVPSLVNRLKETSDIHEIQGLGRQINEMLRRSEVPEHILNALRAQFDPSASLVCRSSSFDEDVAVFGPAPGIYESVIDVDQDNLSPAITDVVASYFGEKAIAYREMLGLPHDPFMAVVVQEYLPGAGGTMFADADGVSVNIVGTPGAVNGHDTSQLEEHFVAHSDDEDTAGLVSSYFDNGSINRLIESALQAHRIYGPSDIEFGSSPDGQPLIVQMRKLDRKPHIEVRDEVTQSLAKVVLGSLGERPDIGTEPVSLEIGDVDLDAFQANLFTWIIQHRDAIREIVISRRVPPTCHFVNIVETLGIRVVQPDESHDAQ